MKQKDEDYYTKSTEGVEYTPCKIDDFSKLDIRDGVIHYRLYGQDGVFIPMTIEDTYSNRLFASWVQIHDRYSGGKKHEPK